MNTRTLARLGALSLLAAAALGASAQEAQIRKNLAERLPSLPKIDEVSRTSVPGLWEIRIGNDVMYTDDKGDHIIQGQIVDTRTRANITESRLNKLSAIDFASLPLKDAVVIKQGSGARKMAVFVDPNCGYCKRFEKDLAAVKDVTVYTFLYPILGPDSDAKSKAIWCAKDPAKTWRDWMLSGVTPPRSMGDCDTAALERNVAFGKKHRVQGTPAMVFEDGTRVPGAIPGAEVEKHLAESSRKS
ncbi:DsbC family protein [Azohydromonas australica]|uniref:DsbC family protein n=1 Tax=Azohydromonas australica TaxID=364039 RepID=UPI000406D635|nr:DsbC family protein [Azohydromonas australica]